MIFYTLKKVCEFYRKKPYFLQKMSVLLKKQIFSVFIQRINAETQTSLVDFRYDVIFSPTAAASKSHNASGRWQNHVICGIKLKIPLKRVCFKTLCSCCEILANYSMKMDLFCKYFYVILFVLQSKFICMKYFHNTLLFIQYFTGSNVFKSGLEISGRQSHFATINFVLTTMNLNDFKCSYTFDAWIFHFYLSLAPNWMLLISTPGCHTNTPFCTYIFIFLSFPTILEDFLKRKQFTTQVTFQFYFLSTIFLENIFLVTSYMGARSSILKKTSRRKQNHIFLCVQF